MRRENKLIALGRAKLPALEFTSSAENVEALESLVHFLRQQYGVILITSLLIIALGVTYLIVARPSYTAVANMLIDTRKAQFLQQQPSLTDVSFVESQTRILKSDNVALSVIKNLQLNEDPEFIGSVLKDGAASKFVYVMRSTLGVFGLSLKDDTVSKLVDFMRRALNVFGFGMKNGAESEFDVMRRALDVFVHRLDIKRDGLSYVIEISFRSYDADKAARIANAIVDAYIVDQLDAKYQSTLHASNWLQDRIRELLVQATAAEQALVDYKKEHNIIDAAGKSTSAQRVSELNSQLLIVRAKMAEARARLIRIQEVLSSDPSSAVNATVADTLKNEVVTKLRSQYLEYARKEADWSARYGSDHLASVNLRNYMREIRSSIVDELRRLAETYKSDYEITKRSNDDIQKEYDQAVAQAQKTGQAQVVLSDLESKSKTYRALYENFLQRYMESVQQQSFPITEARLISPAVRPYRKSNPKTFLTLAISAFAGIIFGFGIGIFRNLWDSVFRTSEQVEKTLHATCISLVPSLKSNTAPTLPLVETPIKEAPSPRTLVHDSNVFWTIVDSPFSRFAESIRAIKVAFDLSRINKSTKVIGFTSSLPNEGKSTLAAALALLIAQAGGRAILVDCDLRNPSLSRVLAPSAKAGFIEVVSGKVSIDDALWWSDPKTNLSFLPAVVESRVADTAEILASAATKNLFNELRQRFDYIIVDLSPLAPVVDVRTTTHFVNSYVYVIEWGSTKIDIVKKALSDARGVYENLLGMVLNKADINKLSRYEAHRGKYYDNEHYVRYGYGEGERSESVPEIYTRR